MARVPTRTSDAPYEAVSELVITAGEWEAMLLEDPQASPDWKETWPYGSWRWRLPGNVRRERPRLGAPEGGPEPGAADPAAGAS